MSSSDDEDALALVQLINIRTAHRRFWVHPVWQSGQDSRLFTALQNLRHYPDRFHDVYKMSPQCFQYILNKNRTRLQKKCTNFRMPVSPEERLLITLRYFADGCSFKSLSIYFMRGKSTVQKLVNETCEILWECLRPEFMPTPTTEKWIEAAQRFYTLWNLPHCVGSIDGKHIRIRAPPNSGSSYINYKQYFSVVLLGVVDANGLFLTIDVGEYGRNSDGRALQESNFGQALLHRELNLPAPCPLPGETQNMPYYFVGDEAFPLKENLMKPYARNQLTNARRVFNNRLSRGRKSVECAFGMIRAKFEGLSKPITCDPSKVDIIIQAMCVIHNVIRRCDGKFSVPRFQNNLSGSSMNVPPLQVNSEYAKNIREYLTKYFHTIHTPIPYQNRFAV